MKTTDSFENQFRQLIRDELAPLHKELLEVKKSFLYLAEPNKISYNLKEAAELTGLSSDSLYNFFRNGRLPAQQLAGKGGSISVLRRDLVELMVSRLGEKFSLTDPSLKRIVNESKKE